MRIAFDLRCVFKGMGGIGHYAASLLAEFALHGRDPEWVGYFTHLRAPDDLRFPERFVARRFPCGMIDAGFQQHVLPSLLAEDGIDLYFNPTFDVPAVRGDTKTVATIHDVVFRRHPELVEPRLRSYLDAATRRAVRSADGLITVSEFSRGEIAGLYGVNPARIQVIPNGVRPAPEATEARTGKHFLYVGSIEPKKNIELLLQAFARLPRTELRLVLAGGRGPGEYPVEERIRALGLEDRVQAVGYVSTDHLEHLYANALAFVYPSRYEGFGLPPLEAMARGVPTIVARTSSLPEVVGEAAILVDPDGPDELAAALARLADSPCEREALAARGRERARRFSWAESARLHLEFFESLVKVHEDSPSCL